MAEFGFVGFQKAFNKAVPSYDETKYYFINGSKRYSGTTLHFVHGGKLVRIHMYLSQYEIDNWAAHMEEYCATGEFDFHVYHTVYKSSNDNPPKSIRYGTEVYKHPLEVDRHNQLNGHTTEWSDFMMKYRSINGDCGFTQVGKDTK